MLRRARTTVAIGAVVYGLEDIVEFVEDETDDERRDGAGAIVVIDRVQTVGSLDCEQIVS
jgi:hypothetical protein